MEAVTSRVQRTLVSPGGLTLLAQACGVSLPVFCSSKFWIEPPRPWRPESGRDAMTSGTTYASAPAGAEASSRVPRAGRAADRAVTRAATVTPATITATVAAIAAMVPNRFTRLHSLAPEDTIPVASGHGSRSRRRRGVCSGVAASAGSRSHPAAITTTWSDGLSMWTGASAVRARAVAFGASKSAAAAW